LGQTPQSSQQAPDRVVRGVVTDGAGPIAGVTVSVKGGTQVAVTNAQGAYSVTVPDGDAVLVFSCLGYSPQEFVVGTRQTIDVVMAFSVDQIEEVVVVGFGTQKRVNLTGAVSTVSAADLQNRPVQNIQQALQGLVPGLNIGQSSGMMNSAPTVNIRGTTNLGTGSSGSPLILIDGVESIMSNLNPQDVESISVLKDAAASSIYGSRAPFGVVLITTKKGSAGDIKVNYNTNLRWNAPTKLPTPMESLSLSTWLNDMSFNDGLTAYVTDETIQRIKDYQAGKITTETIASPSGNGRWATGFDYGNANNNFYKILYKDWGFSQEHNVNASGGNERFTFYMGVGYQDQNGLLEIAKDNRRLINPTATIEAKMTDWMKLRMTTRYWRSEYNRPTEFDNWTLWADIGRNAWSNVAYYDPNGHVLSTIAVRLTDQGRSKDISESIFQHGRLILEPVKNWVTNIELNYESKRWTKNTVVLETIRYDVANNPFITNNLSSVTNDYSTDNRVTLNAYSSYNLSLADSHNFMVMAGMQTEEMKLTAGGMGRQGVIIPDLPVLDLTNGLDANGKAVVPTVYGNENSWKTAGFFGRLNYDYRGRYLLELNARYDGSSRFRRENRWNWFTSFSAGWNIANEDFWKNLAGTVGLLKLRASYGELGNQNTNNMYPTYQTMSVSSGTGPWLQGGVKPNVAYTPGLINSALTWEKINTLNVGLDAAAFNHRLTASFDYYVRRTLDMIGTAVELPVILGQGAPLANNLDLKTQGFEFEVGWKDRLQNGLSYSARFLLSDSYATITSYPNATKSLGTYYEGQRLGNIWGYETIGIAKTDEEMSAHLASMPNGAQNALGSNWRAGDIMYRDLNDDGRINAGSSTLDDPGDRKIIGNSASRYRFGLDLSAAWKGFDVRVFFQGVGKRDMWNSSPALFGINTHGFWYQMPLMEHLDYFRAEPSGNLPANPDSYYPRPLYNNSAKNQHTQTRYLQNAAYVRLKNLSVGYTIPSNISQKFAVRNLRIYFSAENIWTLTKLAPMFDPEAIDGLSEYGNVYPIHKIMSLGLNITF
jgi:TonB-linked SusC/RagA family outer membrane protein